MFATTTLLLLFCSGGYILYGLGFLTVFPAYQMKVMNYAWIDVDKTEICEKGMPKSLWRINYED